MRIIIVIVLISLLLQLTAYAKDFNLNYEYMDNVNKTRMTQLEQNRVERFSNAFAKRNKGRADGIILYNAIRVITELSNYSLEGKKPANILDGLANCQGYSSMLQILLTKCKIETEVIVNDKHMWNRINVGGKWFDIDVTNYDTLMRGG